MEKAHITDLVNECQRNLLFGLDLGLSLRFSFGFLLHRLHGFATAHQVTGRTTTGVVNNHDKSTLFTLILLTLLFCQTITPHLKLQSTLWKHPAYTICPKTRNSQGQVLNKTGPDVFSSIIVSVHFANVFVRNCY